MKFRPAAMALVMIVLSGWAAWGQGPDTAYVRIYNMIQEADGLRERGQIAEAAQRYEEARRTLLQFREHNPTWHQNVVNYRLNYIASRLQPLAEALSKTDAAPAPPGAEPKPAPAPPAAEPKPAVAAEAKPDPAEAAARERLQNLEAEIGRLSEQNSRLQEKLKEAWAAQPASVDPAELAKARERIIEVEKERDLLVVTLDQQTEQKDRAPLPVDTTIIEQERRILVEVKRQLAEEQARNMVLRQENVTLRQQLTEAQGMRPTTPLPETDLAKPLTEAGVLIAELRATNVALRTQLVFLEAQMAEVIKSSAQTGAPERMDALKTVRSELHSTQKERDSLAKQMAAATRRLERRKQGEEIEELERQLEEAHSRLAALEAEAVPLTPEEAALVKEGANIQVAVTQKQPAAATAAGKATQLPPGAGPLFAKARRAIEQGQLKEAKETLLEVLHQDENNVYTLANLAGVELELRQPEEAEKYLQKALSLEPTDPGSLYLFGILRFQQGKYDEALDALSQSARLNPDKPETQFFLGLTLLQKGNRGPAETALRKAIQLRPGWSNAHYELAVVYATQKPPFKELAQWHYQKAIRGGSPRNFDLEKLLDDGGSATGMP